MTYAQAQRWLGLYFLLLTAFEGSILLLFSGSGLLPLEGEDASSAFQILIPVLIGQMAVIFQWLAGHTPNDSVCPIPAWAIRTPPIIALFILLAAHVSLVLANNEQSILKTSPETFKNAVTLAVSILNASTVFLVAKLFPPTRETSG